MKLIGPFEEREGVLHLRPNLVARVGQLPVDLRELRIERLHLAEGVAPLHGHPENQRGLQHLAIEAVGPGERTLPISGILIARELSFDSRERLVDGELAFHEQLLALERKPLKLRPRRRCPRERLLERFDGRLHGCGQRPHPAAAGQQGPSACVPVIE